MAQLERLDVFAAAVAPIIWHQIEESANRDIETSTFKDAASDAYRLAEELEAEAVRRGDVGRGLAKLQAAVETQLAEAVKCLERAGHKPSADGKTWVPPVNKAARHAIEAEDVIAQAYGCLVYVVGETPTWVRAQRVRAVLHDWLHRYRPDAWPKEAPTDG